MNINLGKKKIGSGQKLYIVFEAGPTHYGLSSALKLIDQASIAGADAIKFQLCDHDRLITTKKLPFTYEILLSKKTNKTKKITEPLINIWKRRYIPKTDWIKLKKRCVKRNIDFFATVFFEEDVNLLKSIGVNSFKIASHDINFKDLIIKCAKTKLPVQIDTGNASISNIERAIEWITSTGNNKIIINHCPSGYPARYESINLNVIKTLKKMFDYPIAYSDHSTGWEMDIAARSFGADIIEKTITLDRTIKSCEHIMSLELDDMIKFVESMKNLELVFGSYRRILSSKELKKNASYKRSAFLTKDVRKNDLLKRKDFDFRRPGDGLIRPDNYEFYIGRKFKTSVSKNTMIQKKHIL